MIPVVSWRFGIDQRARITKLHESDLSSEVEVGGESGNLQNVGLTSAACNHPFCSHTNKHIFLM